MINQPNSVSTGIRNVKLNVVPWVEMVAIGEGKVDGPSMVGMNVDGVVVEAEHSVAMGSGRGFVDELERWRVV